MLTKSLYEMSCKMENVDVLIWKGHNLIQLTECS